MNLLFKRKAQDSYYELCSLIPTENQCSIVNKMYTKIPQCISEKSMRFCVNIFLFNLFPY